MLPEESDAPTRMALTAANERQGVCPTLTWQAVGLPGARVRRVQLCAYATACHRGRDLAGCQARRPPKGSSRLPRWGAFGSPQELRHLRLQFGPGQVAQFL